MDKQLVRIRIPNPAIACDFCDAPLVDDVINSPTPHHWAESEIGPCVLKYCTCSACSTAQQENPINLLDRVVAGVKRARRYDADWAESLDRFLATIIWHAPVEPEVCHE